VPLRLAEDWRLKLSQLSGGGSPEQFALDAPSTVASGQTVTATLGLKAAGRMQGFSARLAWNSAVVEPIEMRSGRFIEGQGGLVLAPRLGIVDAALLGLRDGGIAGEGDVATLTFRVLRAGDAGIRLDQVIARDAANQPILPAEIAQSSRLETPLETTLFAPAPNPLRGAAALTFALAGPGAVDLAVYSVDGRRVRTLVSGRREAGVYHAVWDGRDDERRSVAPGIFYAHLSAGGRQFTKKMVYLR